MKTEETAGFIFTPEALKLIQRQKTTPERLLKAWWYTHQVRHEDGSGELMIHNNGQRLNSVTRQGITIERILLPAGVFRRVTKDGEVIRFQNLTETRKALK